MPTLAVRLSDPSMWKGSATLKDLRVADISADEALRLLGEGSDARLAMEALFRTMRTSAGVNALMLFIVDDKDQVLGFVELSCIADQIVWRGPHWHHGAPEGAEG